MKKTITFGVVLAVVLALTTCSILTDKEPDEGDVLVPDVSGKWLLFVTNDADALVEWSVPVTINQDRDRVTFISEEDGTTLATGAVTGDFRITWQWEGGTAGGARSTSGAIGALSMSGDPDSESEITSWRADKIDGDPVSPPEGLLQGVDTPCYRELKAAGIFTVNAPRNGATGPTVTEEEQMTDPVGKMVCTSTPWQETLQRTFDDATVLATNPNIFAGSVIQGQPFRESGDFVPVTIARGGGTIQVKNLAFAPLSSYSDTLEEIEPTTVQQAVEDILSQNVVGTVARGVYSYKQVYSQEDLYFRLGLDARYRTNELEAQLEINTSEKRNHILMSFTQVFYDVEFPAPEHPEDFFAGGSSYTFKDEYDQIFEGNPPLYVSSVSYGRQIFFLASSVHSASDVEASLRIAAELKGAAGGEVRTGLTCGEVMADTTVKYLVRGGAAGLALAPIDSATPEAMFDAIKSAIADPAAADFSKSNPGIPVSFSLAYVLNNHPVTLNMTTIAPRVDCSFVPNENHAWTFQAVNFNYQLRVYFDGNLINDSHAPWGGQTTYTVDLTDRMSGTADHVLEYELTNGDCFGTWAQFYLRKDGHIVMYYNCKPATWFCGMISNRKYRMNNSAGGSVVTL